MTPINRTSQRTRRDLSRAEIIAIAERIMREDGEAAVSMRRVARECGVTPMAIYHHVGSKEDLLTLVVDHVVGDAIEDVSNAVGWRSSMGSFCAAFRRGLLANPGAAAVFLRRPIVSSNLAVATERMFAILEDGGIEGPAAAAAVDAIVLLLMGSIANDLTRPAEIRRGLIDNLPASAAPRLSAGIENYAVRDAEARFATALGWLLDGIEQEQDTS